MTNTTLLKQQLRRQVGQQRQALSPQHRQQHSLAIFQRCQRYLNSISNHAQHTELLIYRALPFEVDTTPFFEVGFTHIYAPRMLKNAQLEWVRITANTTWQQADFAVWQPQQGKVWQKSKHHTTLICPLLAFDRFGNRLGMGKGYFDRWLENHQTDINTQLGLAFSLQELCKVPTEPHDAPLTTIITEHEVITCLNT